MPPTNGLDQRQSDLAGIGSAKLYLFSAVGLIVLMVLAFLAILLIRPEALDQRPARNLGYLLALCIVGLFAGAGINVVNVLNGHQAVLMRAIGEKERVKGKLEGLQENPKVNIE